MSRIAATLIPIALLVLFLAAPAAQAQEPVPDKPSIADLGDGRYQIGAIVVDKTQGRFTVPGRMLELSRPEDPLEFVAVARHGQKAYESLFEVDATAFEFNLACILIGLENRQPDNPDFHFDPKPVPGDPVTIRLSWTLDGTETALSPERLLLEGGFEPPPGTWVYTGSRFDEQGTYTAHQFGTLIGFVHDMDSVIQHRAGLGLGDYGAITTNTFLAPPPGTPITVTVSKGGD
ncbi:MAG: hypothetical protein KDE22_06815 [Rhodobacterales bacterium]|nr:hypothetical protein [Rhodobacterales bacterium]